MCWWGVWGQGDGTCKVGNFELLFSLQTLNRWFFQALTDYVNLMAMSLVNQVHSAAPVTKAVIWWRKSKLALVERFWSQKRPSMEWQRVWVLFADKATHVVREVRPEGWLGCQARATDTGAMWKDFDGCQCWFSCWFSWHYKCKPWLWLLYAFNIPYAVAECQGFCFVDCYGLWGFDVENHWCICLWRGVELGQCVNDVVDQLATFADEAKKVAWEVGTEGKLGVQAEVGNVQAIWQEIRYVSFFCAHHFIPSWPASSHIGCLSMLWLEAWWLKCKVLPRFQQWICLVTLLVSSRLSNRFFEDTGQSNGIQFVRWHPEEHS